MKLLAKLRFMAIVTAFAAVPFAAGFYVESAQAHEGEDHTGKVAQTGDTEENKPEEASAKYEYTAQSGDSYAQIARKAVQTYGLTKDAKLSTAQIVFAETNLTKAAGSPFLLIGQKISIEESVVKEWVEKAQKLSDGQKAAWEVWTVGVDFNTNNVGEKR
jgi:hypothetical protein